MTVFIAQKIVIYLSQSEFNLRILDNRERRVALSLKIVTGLPMVNTGWLNRLRFAMGTQYTRTYTRSPFRAV